MVKVTDSLRNPKLIEMAREHDCGCVYPLSVAEGIQSGDIFLHKEHDYEKALIRTQSGFAYLIGTWEDTELDEIYNHFFFKKQEKRFLLMTKDVRIENYFALKNGIVIEKRYLFSYTGAQKQFEIQLPDGYKIKEIDDRSLERLEGTILPSLFWRNASDFLTKGKGYCITSGEETGVGLSLYEYSIPKNSRKAGISKGKRVYANKAGYLKHVR